MKSTRLRIPLLFLAALCGCSDDDPVKTTTDNSTGGAGGEAPDLAALYACDETDFRADAWSGPGVDDDGTFADLTRSSYVVHTTQLIVRPGMLGEVYELSAPVIATMRETPGLVAFSSAGSDVCGNLRTLGVWESEEAMTSLVLSEAHGHAMMKSGEVGLSGKFVHWESTAAEVEVLDWDVVKTKLAEVSPYNDY